MPLKQYLIDNVCTMYLCKSYFLSRHYMYLACYLNLTCVLHDCYHFCVCENLIRLAGVVVALKSGQLRLHNFWQKASHGRVPRMEWHIHIVGYGQKKMKSSLCGHSMTFQGNFNPEKNHQALSIQGWHFVNTHQIAHIPSIGRPIRFQQRPQHPRPAREPPVWSSFWRDLPRACTARCVPRAGALALRCSMWGWWEEWT